jgi:hypothetical protein
MTDALTDKKCHPPYGTGQGSTGTG